MRAAAIAILATLALALPAGASDTDVDVIDDAVQAAIDARKAGEGYAEAKAAIYAVVTDEDAKPTCRAYADIALVALTIIDAGELMPASDMHQTVFEWAMDAAPVARNDCLLAI